MITNAITIHAPPEAIWPWLVQLGYYRDGLLYRGRHGIKPAGILSYIPIPTFVFCSPNPSARMLRWAPVENSHGGFFLERIDRTHTRLLLRT